jgi:hypothetical protein
MLMKTTALVRYAAVAVLASAPLFAQAAGLDTVQRCMDVFATQNFSDRATTFKIDDDYSPRLPLTVNSGTRYVQLVASDRSSGRVIAKANCSVRAGVITIGDISVLPLVAVR